MKHRIKVGLNKRGGQTKDLPIRLRVTYESQRVDIHTGYTIDLNKWDEKKGKAKHGITSAQGYTYSEINSGLADRVKLIEDTFARLDLEGVTPTFEKIKEAFNQVYGRKPAQEKTFFTIFDEFVQEVGILDDWKKTTYEKFSVTKKHLREFDPELTFESLDEKKLTDYVNFLKENMVNATIANQFDFLKWFLRWATQQGYNTNRAYSTFKAKLTMVQKKVIFLNWDELMTVYNFDIPETKNYLRQVRDVFCFCCFSSLRYSDVKNLRRSNIKDDHIEIITKKTADSLIIELNDYSREILERYKDIPYKDNKALPVISNQKMNDYLKELGELCGIDEPITQTKFRGNERIEETKPKYKLLSTHCGRRTFICNALSLGIAADIVMKWTGHSDYKAMKPYIDITDQAKKEAMTVFNKK